MLARSHTDNTQYLADKALAFNTPYTLIPSILSLSLPISPHLSLSLPISPSLSPTLSLPNAAHIGLDLEYLRGQFQVSPQA